MAKLAFPARVDATNVAELTQTLRGLRGQDVIVDLSQTERIGGQGGQVLHAAQRTWSEDGRSLTFANIAASLTHALDRLGLSHIVSAEEARP